MRGILFICMLCSICMLKAQQALPDFDIEQVSGNVYLALVKQPGNGTLIGAKITIQKGEEGILLVDCNFEALYRLTNYKLSQFSDKKVEYVINTHFHPDHTGANSNFIEAGATVIAHENLKDVLSREQHGHGLGAVGVENVFPAVPSESLPNKTFKDELVLNYNGDKVIIKHYANSHTNGDAVVYFTKDNVFDLGDIIWPGSFPFVDWMNGGSANGIVKTLNSILKKSNNKTKFISGHGPVMSYDELKAYRDMVKETVGIIEKMKKKGLSLEEAQAMGLPEKWDKWSGLLSPTEIWIEMIYKSNKK